MMVVAVALALALPALAQEAGEQPPARQAVIEFLALSGDQVAQWDGLLATHKATVTPLRDQLQGVEDQLKTLLQEPDPDPGAVGELAIQAKGLRDQIRAADEDYLTGFGDMLTQPQTVKLAFIRHAARVQPLIPAFKRFGLVPALPQP
jgi:Heavy-metal resistance